MRSRPSQKLGMETPPRATSMASRSSQELGRSAARMPKTRPMATAMAIAAAASSSVLGSWSAISSATGRLL